MWGGPLAEKGTIYVIFLVEPPYEAPFKLLTADLEGSTKDRNCASVPYELSSTVMVIERPMGIMRGSKVPASLLRQ